MMTTLYYPDEDAIAHIGEGFAAHTLPKEEWTHAAHFAAAIWLLRMRPDIVPERDMPDMIRSYNESVGGVNSDTGGYHETITQASIRATRAVLAGLPDDMPLYEAHAVLMSGPCGDKGWLFTYWSKDVLMSVKARREWVEPDVKALPF